MIWKGPDTNFTSISHRSLQIQNQQNHSPPELNSFKPSTKSIQTYLKVHSLSFNRD
jgi:hypothetical protein